MYIYIYVSVYIYIYIYIYTLAFMKENNVSWSYQFHVITIMQPTYNCKFAAQ